MYAFRLLKAARIQIMLQITKREDSNRVANRFLIDGGARLIVYMIVFGQAIKIYFLIINDINFFAYAGLRCGQ